MARLIRDRADEFVQHLPDAMAGDVSAIHRARVASRRLREVLPVASRLAPDAPVDRLRREVRRVTRRLGEVREVDVVLACFGEEAERQHWSVSSVAHVRRRLERERERRHRRMRAHLGSIARGRLRARFDAVAGYVEAPALAPACERALNDRLARRSRTLGDAVRAAGTLYVPERLHAVRIAGKKLRYSLEFAREAAHVRANRDARFLRQVQDRLGRLHDLQMLQSHLRRVAAEPPARQASATIGDLSDMIAVSEVACRTLHAEFLVLAPAVERLCERVDRRAAGRLLRPVRLKMARMDRSRIRNEARASGPASRAQSFSR